MAEPYIGEIKMFGFGWAPAQWALCDGATMTINQNQALYSVVGTNYGGDGRTNFNLPDLRGRTPVHKGTLEGTSVSLGTKSGVENVTITEAEMPLHTHVVSASSEQANTKILEGNFLATSMNRGVEGGEVYRIASNLVGLNPNAVSSAGGANGHTNAHTNMQPTIVISFCMALDGQYPSRN